MGVGYQVSPLHRMIRLDTSALHGRAVAPGESPPFDPTTLVAVAPGPLPLRSSSKEAIVAWRQRIAGKYRDQLDEELTWDEGDSYENSDDVATSGDVMLRFAAAVLDQRGQVGLKSMAYERPPTSDELEAAFVGAERRGFGGRYPQLLLGATFWLPFPQNLMIEEPDWDGKLKRYGSVLHLVDELTAIRAAIAGADPSAEQSTEQDGGEYSLAGAWQTSVTILRLATIAQEKHLPLWTTG